MRKVLYILLLLPEFLFAQIQIDNKNGAGRNSFPLAVTGSIASVYCDTLDYEVVKKTALYLIEDIERVTEKRTQLISLKKGIKNNVIIVGTIGKNRLIDELVKSKKIDLDSIKGQWERFIVKKVDNPFPGVKQALVIAGSDRRGTAFGVFTLSEAIGVSPWYWWADVPVKKSNTIYVETNLYISKAPSIKFRGIFLNDEDWGLLPWAAKKIDPTLKDIGPGTYAKVCELLLRLKANILWPAMHEVTGAFNKYPENKMVADSFGIIMGSSHCEPLLYNNAAEWNKKTMGEWNYITNKNGILEQLDQRVKSNSPYENFYTLALRGLHDGGMIGNLTVPEQVQNLENAIIDQRNLLAKYIKMPLESIPQVFIPYKEVMDLYNKEAKIPDDVTIVWPDDNYGYIKRLSTPEEQKRSGRSGVYYHVSYLGEPHNNLWMSTTPPALMYEELSKAYRTGADRIWVLNVGDVKACEYSTNLFLDMAWNIDKYSYDNVSKDHARWTTSIFGEQFKSDFLTIWDKFYHLSFVRKPEFMGWGYEWNGSGSEKIVDTEFSFSNYNEAEKRISNYDLISNKAAQIMAKLKEEQKAAYFQLVYYPVKAAALMNKKMLLAQKNREYFKENRSKTNLLGTEAKSCFDSLQLITDQYNSLLNGKWQGMMSLKQGWFSNVHTMPPIDQLSLPDEAILAVFPEGHKSIKSSPDLSMSLPVFNSFAPKEYYIDVVNKGSIPLQWTATVSEPWIKLSSRSGKTSDEQRIYVSIDWEKCPAEEYAFGDITFLSGVQKEKISISTFSPQNVKLEELEGLFTEQNGCISIPAADFHRKSNDRNVEVQIIDGLGIENKSIQFGDPRKRVLDSRATFKASTEYDFYSFSSGWVTIMVYTLPVFPLNPTENTSYELRIDNGLIKRPDIEAKEYSDEWKENVLKNAAVNTIKYYLPAGGKHCLKISCKSQGMVIQKIIIDAGGLKNSYLGPESSKSIYPLLLRE